MNYRVCQKRNALVNKDVNHFNERIFKSESHDPLNVFNLSVVEANLHDLMNPYVKVIHIQEKTDVV
jgi:hypothetical protein